MKKNVIKKIIKNIWALLTFVLVVGLMIEAFVYGGRVMLAKAQNDTAATIITAFLLFLAGEVFFYTMALRLIYSIKAYKKTGMFKNVTYAANTYEESKG